MGMSDKLCSDSECQADCLHPPAAARVRRTIGAKMASMKDFFDSLFEKGRKEVSMLFFVHPVVLISKLHSKICNFLNRQNKQRQIFWLLKFKEIFEIIEN